MPDRRLIGLVGAILLLLALAVLSTPYRSIQGPEIKPHQGAVEANHAQQPTQGKPSEAGSAPPRVPSVFPSSGDREGKTETEHGGENSSKGEGGFLGTPLNAEVVIAIFTILLFAATFALYLATRDLVKGADRTAERQLRAYLIVEASIAGEPREDKSITAEIFVRNYGQTPARDVILSRGIDILPYAGTSRSNNIKPLTPTIVGPGHRIGGVAVLPPNLNRGPSLSSEESKGLGVIVFGDVTYTDIFNERRSTEYRLMMLPAVGGGVHLVPCPEGNHYT